jgi:hypothetical protein
MKHKSKVCVLLNGHWFQERYKKIRRKTETINEAFAMVRKKLCVHKAIPKLKDDREKIPTLRGQ